MKALSGSNRRAIFGLVVLTLLWGYNWVVMKQALHSIGAFDFSALRCGFGAAFLFLILRLRGQPLKPTPWKPTIIVGVLQIGGMVGFSQWALVSGGAGKVAILVYTMPFWVVLMAALFLGERLRHVQYLAVLLAAAGIILVLQPWNMAGSWWSSLLALTSGIVWAAGAVTAKRFHKSYPGLDLLSLTTWQMVVGAILMIVVALCVPQPQPVWNGYVLFGIAYNAILATAVGWSLWFYLLRALPATIAGLSTLAIPVCGVFFAWAILGEVPSLIDDAGMVLIVVALGLISLSQNKAPRPSEP